MSSNPISHSVTSWVKIRKKCLMFGKIGQKSIANPIFFALETYLDSSQIRGNDAKP